MGRNSGTHRDVPGLAIGRNVIQGGLVPGVYAKVIVEGGVVSGQVVAEVEKYTAQSSILQICRH